MTTPSHDDPRNAASPELPFDRRFAKAADRLLLFVRLRLGPALAARTEELDVLQDVYVAARAASERLEERGDGAFLAWLCTIAAHRLADLGRAQARDLARPAGRGSAGRAGAHANLSRVLELAHDARTGPLTAAVRVDARDALARAIDALEPEPREVLLAHFFEGRTQAQIAEATGRSPSAIQRELANALVAVGRPLRAAFGDGGSR